MKLVRGWAVLTAVFFAQGIWASVPTPHVDAIENILANESLTDLDQLLARLNPKWRGRMMLVYHSRSLQSASLDRPRVILSAPDNQFFAAFSGAEGLQPADQRLELLEAYGAQAPRFAEVLPDPDTGRLRLRRDPPNCFTCHKGQPIWDSYPHWPGFFGSTHNGRAYGEPGGSGRLARLEFEVAALARFQQNAPVLPRYRQLVGLQDQTVAKLAIRNTVTGTAISASLQQRQHRQILESIGKDLPALRRAYVSSFPFETYGLDAAEHYPEYLNDEAYAGLREFIRGESEPYRVRADEAATIRFGKILEDVRAVGTGTDRLRLERARIFSSYENYRPEFLPYPELPADLGIPVANVMNYFDSRDLFRYPGMYYRYWLQNNPGVEALPLNNGLEHADIRFMNGIVRANLMTSATVGYEDLTATGYVQSARNYRDFAELYDWIDLPLKQFVWAEVAGDSILSAAFSDLQAHYLDVLEQSPLRKTGGAEILRELPSWSPENRTKLEELLALE